MIETILEYYRSLRVKDPVKALQARMFRQSNLYSQGKLDPKKMVKLCPRSVKTIQQAKTAGCEHSWKLRRPGTWANTQVEDFTVFKNPSDMRNSKLYRSAYKLHHY